MASERGLTFVNASNLDEFRNEHVRRIVRRRVMRDIGRARRKQKHPAVVTFVWQQLIASTAPVSLRKPCLDSHQLPFDTDPRARELIHFMNSEAEYKYRPFRKIWFSMALTDQSAFTLCMANAAMFLEQTRHPETFRYERCEETLRYYGRCVEQVTDRLSDPVDSTSEGILTTILGLICHDLYVGTLSRWEYHIRGLAEIVRIRGGIHDLPPNIQLFACWFDVLGSVVQDLPPRLPGFSALLERSFKSAGQQPRLLRDTIKEIRTSPIAISILVPVLEKAVDLFNFVNNQYLQRGFWKAEDDTSPVELIGTLTHELLALPRADYSKSNGYEVVREMTRLALLILLSGLKASYGFSAVEMTALQKKFSWLTLEIRKLHEALPFQRLQLWCFLVAAILHPVGTKRSLYLEQISLRMTSMNVPNGYGAIQAARDLLWIEVLASGDEITSLVSDIDNYNSGKDWRFFT
ncbi:hypothetical protein N7532_006982 [Penicillium argentinense]|uniref:Uncharacterized protein n=1 Tax=Penicillium argentinense TaxID=1131581 RepID=A0A9W9FH07_9EURO|nr:uncharacterized protein N7532_006982 [Penicillium argentinense]KAJ5099981.1 hypothetical protein N7532_006982 [Penicillium argentinense]